MRQLYKEKWINKALRILFTASWINGIYDIYMYIASFQFFQSHLVLANIITVLVILYFSSLAYFFLEFYLDKSA
jgi:hypothetical protein